jgi:hypothetical protein
MRDAAKVVPEESGYLKRDRRMARPSRVVAVPRGWRAYWTLRIALGVALLLSDPEVLRTGCMARRTGLGSNPRLKLI